MDYKIESELVAVTPFQNNEAGVISPRGRTVIQMSIRSPRPFTPRVSALCDWKPYRIPA